MSKVKFRRVMGVSAMGLLVLALVTACSNSATPSGTSAGQPEQTNLVVGAVPAQSNAGLFIAQERGIFAAHGLRVKVEDIASTSDIVPDMLHGSIDVAAGQVPGFIAAQAAGVGSFRVLANGFSLGPRVKLGKAFDAAALTKS